MIPARPDSHEHPEARSGPVDRGRARFQRVRPLGAGSFGEVDLVREVASGSLFARKTISLEEERRFGILEREVRLRDRLRHPQIPRVREFRVEPEDRRAFLLTDFVVGEPLGKALGVESARAHAGLLLAQALNVLAFVHGRGVVHGDVQPGNLLVGGLSPGATPFLYLIDFGTALDRGRGETVWRGGVAAFLAPWLLDGEAPGEASDLFALGQSFVAAASDAGLEFAPELQAVLTRLTCSDPSLGFPDAESALRELLSSSPSIRRDLEHTPLSVPQEAPFVGRTEELRWLEERFEGLRAGTLDQRLVLLEGAEGVGKSRLLQEFRREAVLAGAHVYRLPCLPGGGPLEPFLDLFARLLSPDHPELTRLARALAPTLPSDGRMASAAPDEAGVLSLTQRTLRDLARILRDEAIARPLVLIADDLEHADECTLALLEFLSRLEGTEGPLILGALRHGGPGSSPRVLPQLTSADRLRIEELGEQELAEMVEGLLASPRWDDGDRRDAVRLSRGNAREATRAALALSAGPDGAALRSFFETRLGLCGVAEVELLGALALLARPAPLEVLSGVLNWNVPRTERALEALDRRGLVHRERRAAGDRYVLASQGLAERLLEGLDASRRHELHGRALACWREWSVSLERPPERLAHHALGAGQVEAAFELGLPAASHLVARGALRSAEGLVRSLLDVVAVGARDRQRARRSALTALLAEILHRRGRSEEAEQSGRSLGDPRDPEVPLLPADRMKLLRVLGNLAEDRGDYALARDFFEKALDAGGPGVSSVEMGRAAEALGRVWFREGEYVRSRELWERGLECAAERGTNDAGVAELWNDLGVLDWMEGDFESALSRHAKALRLRRRAGDLDGEACSLTNLALVLASKGDLSRAIDMHTEALRLKRLVGSPGTQALSLRNLGSMYRPRGEFSRAFECLEEAVRLREEANERIGAAGTRLVLARYRHAKGERAAAAEQSERAMQALDEAGVRGPVRAELETHRARVALDEGRFDEAERCARAGLDELGEACIHGTRAELLGLLGRARLARGARTEGVELLESARDAAEASRDRVQLGWACHDLAAGFVLASRADVPPEEQAELRARARGPLATALEIARDITLPELLCATLLVFHDIEVDGPASDEAIRALLEAEHVAVRLALPRLELACALRMALQAEKSGLLNRAVHWYRRGLEALESLFADRSDADVPTLRETPEVRALLGGLASLLAREAGGDAVEPERGWDRRELLQRAVAFLDRPSDADAGAASLRPEVLRRLLEISRALNSMRHREEILAYLCDRLEELFGAENSRIVLLGRDGSYHLMGESEEETERSISRTVIDRVLAEGRPILVDDAQSDLELKHRQSVHRLGLASVLCAPLIVDGRTIGIIQFDHRAKPGPFRADDLAVLELFAHQAATALKNMLLVERLDETIDELRASEAEREAGERMRSLGEMTAGVAHDFNNLLTIVVGVTELMRSERGISSGMRDDLDLLETVSKTAAETVRRLQEFRGESRDRWARIDAARVARQAVEMTRRRFPHRGDISLRYDGVASAVVLGVEAELREVLLNLLINAVEAMPGGGIVSVSCTLRDGRVHVRVEDEGEGIPPEVAARIFEPFFTSKRTGQGMGLSVSRDIVRRMEGRLTVETRAERARGAAFSISLPEAPAREEEVPETPSLREVAGDSRILVVDDDPIVREVVCRLLSSVGYCAVGAEGCMDALAQFRSGAFDLVLTDYVMPDGSGAELARELREIDQGCPIVLLTGATLEGDDIASLEGDVLPRGEEGSFNLVLRKPVTTEKLAAALALRRN
ncbi:MAG TPA: tetratricopeptide repeat protein [Planctomycetes bacterium]|nr:tetratricopeptide repeat protein [Planctomycetota bacterium]